jgi:hypothetical protein
MQSSVAAQCSVPSTSRQTQLSQTSNPPEKNTWMNVQKESCIVTHVCRCMTCRSSSPCRPQCYRCTSLGQAPERNCGLLCRRSLTSLRTGEAILLLAYAWDNPWDHLNRIGTRKDYIQPTRRHSQSCGIHIPWFRWQSNQPSNSQWDMRWAVPWAVRWVLLMHRVPRRRKGQTSRILSCYVRQVRRAELRFSEVLNGR